MGPPGSLCGNQWAEPHGQLVGEHGQAVCPRRHSGAFESSPTLARACQTTAAAAATTQTHAQWPCARPCLNFFCPPSHPRKQSCGSSHVTGEEPEIPRGWGICPGLVCTLNLWPILPLWVGWEGQLGLVMTPLGCVCTGPGWESQGLALICRCSQRPSCS